MAQVYQTRGSLLLRFPAKPYLEGMLGRCSLLVGLTSQITDPAPVAFDLKQGRHRRVRCICFVGPFLHQCALHPRQATISSALDGPANARMRARASSRNCGLMRESSSVNSRPAD